MEVFWVTSHHLEGSTMLAHALARRLASEGHRTLLTSVQEPWWLQRELGMDDLAEPVEVATNLDAVAIDTGAELARHWHVVSELFSKMLTAGNFSHIDADQLALTPWMRTPATGLRLEELHAGGKWARIVIDAGPLALLSANLGYSESMEWFNSRWGNRMKRLNTFANLTLGKVVPLPLPDGKTIARMEEMHFKMLAFSQLQRQQSTIVALCSDDDTGNAFGRQVKAFAHVFEYPVCAPLVVDGVPSAVAEFEQLLEQRAETDEPIVAQAPRNLVETNGKAMELHLDLVLEPSELNVELSAEEITLQVSHFRRQFPLPEGFDPDELQRVAYSNGTLRLEF